MVEIWKGAYAKRDIAAGETICTIPSGVILSEKSAFQGQLGSALEPLQANLTTADVLLLHLMHERNLKESTHSAYFNILPPRFQTTVFWSEEDLKYLEGSQLFDATKQRKEAMGKTYDNLFSFLKEKNAGIFTSEAFSQEQFEWALSLVWSRSVSVKSGESNAFIIIPGVDLFNHGKGMASVQVADDGNSMLVIAETDIPKDTEIGLDYGNKSNSELLLSYGFVLGENPYDGVSLTLNVDKEDVFHAARVSAVEKATGLTETPFEFLITAAGIPRNLLYAMRIILLKSEHIGDLNVLAEKGYGSLNDELHMLRTLGAALQKVSSSYKTSYEEDVELLKEHAKLVEEGQTPKLSVRQATGLSVVAKEKAILEQSVAVIRALWLDYLAKDYPPESSEESNEESRESVDGAVSA